MGIDYKQKWCAQCNRNVRAERRGPNHILHLLLTLVTFGVWAIIWLGVSIRVGGWMCPQCGSRC